MSNTNNAANKIDTSNAWTCPGCGRLMAGGHDVRLPILCFNCREATRSVSKPRDIMLVALGSLLRDNGGKIPEGRTDVSVDALTVRVFGKSAVKSNITVQCVLNAATGYSADIGPKTGKLGKQSTFTP